ncbi:SWIM zinc finger family protein [Photobacterium damselae]
MACTRSCSCLRNYRGWLCRHVLTIDFSIWY